MQTHPDLINREFLARVLPDLDPLRQGRYLVHIPDLMHGIEESGGIWAKNHTHKNRMTISDKGEYGSYFPLQSGTMVIVKFFDEDINTAFIDRIVSDWSTNSNVLGQDCTEVVGAETDRDEQYIIFKTAKKWSAFYVNEDTSKEPNTMYIIYNRDKVGRRTVTRIDETGISVYTRDNRRVRIIMDDNLQIDGNKTEYIKGYNTSITDGDLDVKTGSNLRIEVDGNCNISVDGESFIWGGGNINVDAPTVNINCGIAKRTPAKPKTCVRDLGPKETPEYSMGDGDSDDRPIITGKTCDDATAKHNIGLRKHLNE